MTTKSDLARARGARAKALLADELLVEAYAKIEADLVAGWINSDPRDTDGRERLWAAVQANRKHRDFLVNVLNDGKIAQAELNRAMQQPKAFGA